MKLRSEIVATFLSFVIFLVNFTGALQSFEVEKEDEIVVEEESQVIEGTSRGGGGGGSKNPNPDNSFNLDDYIPDRLDDIGEVDLSLNSLRDYSDSNNSITIFRLLCKETNLPEKISGDCLLRASDFESIDHFLAVSNFYGGFRFSNVGIENGDWIDIITNNQAISFFPTQTDKNNHVTVSGSVYHPDRDYLSSNFRLNLTYTVTGDVYGN